MRASVSVLQRETMRRGAKRRGRVEEKDDGGEGSGFEGFEE